MSLRAKLKTDEIYTFRIPMIKKKNISDITGEDTTIVINSQLCKGCELCVTYCPEDILEMGEELNTKSYHYPHVIDNKEADCKQCRMCERICPELSIYLADKQDKEV